MTDVYKDSIISTIVDEWDGEYNTDVYKDSIISTIVDLWRSNFPAASL